MHHNSSLSLLKLTVVMTVMKDLERNVLRLLGHTVQTAVTADVFSVVDKSLLGNGKSEEIQLFQWVSLVMACDFTVNKIASLNAYLSKKTFLVSQRLTLADVFVFARLSDGTNSFVSDAFPHVCRWFDLLQNTLNVSNRVKLSMKVNSCIVVS